MGQANQPLLPNRSFLALTAIVAVLNFGPSARAQTPTSPPAPAANATPTPDNALLLTIFLKHDQSRPLSELNAQSERQGFYKAFPPEELRSSVGTS
jgi:hypothetical protein